NTSKIHLGSEILLVEAIEAATTKKIADAGNVTGPLVYIGLANEELTAEQKAAASGKVALIDRGVVDFNTKVKRAFEAGAIGVVVANNKPGSPLGMGTKDNFPIPAIMIGLDAGVKVKAALEAKLEVSIEFLAPEKMEKPELIDTLTGFTSKGPRSIDGFIKPEISAPGSNVISAKMGGGNKAVQMSGTSMAAPHVAGVMALLKQAQPTLTAEELKSIAMGTAKTIGENGQRYSITLQGSGRIQADKAAFSKIVIAEPSLSLGEIAVESRKSLRRTLNVKNISKEDLELSVVFDGNGYITMKSDSAVTLKAGESKSLNLTLTLDAATMKEDFIREMDGWVKFMKGEEEVYRVPVLAIAHKLSSTNASDLVVYATSALDADGAMAELTLTNANQNKGEVLLFNMIGQDSRKPNPGNFLTGDCDIQQAGYRIVNRKNESGVSEEILQVAVKTYKPMTTWTTCDISLLIDTNADGLAEQELLGSILTSIPGQKSEEFASTLLDATKARAIRKAYEAEVAKVKDDHEKVKNLTDALKYDDSIVDQQNMKIYNNSTVVIIEAAVSKLARTAEGNLAFKLVSSHNEQSSVQMDDFFADTFKTDRQLSLKAADQSFFDLPEVVVLVGGQTKKIELTKGAGTDDLLVLMPNNKFSTSDLLIDSQAQLLQPRYQSPSALAVKR
ncbi:MAG: S8 family serine peptidase, partial [Bdellovibrionaceae bacterium]|nr:S8 family serine peptidase [Bdellovibrio sp.]